jgi:hypothetical protein
MSDAVQPWPAGVTPSLDGWRLTGRYLPAPDDASAGDIR